jgi:hypothetical protein
VANDEDVIDSAVVRIGPDLSKFRAKLEKDLVKAVKGIEAKVAVVADGTGLRNSVKEAVAKQSALRGQPVYKVKVVADGTGLRQSVRLVVKEQMALGNQPVYKVKVVADERGLKNSIANAGKSVVQATQRTENEMDRVRAAATIRRQRGEEQAARDRVRTAERAARDQARAEERAAREQVKQRNKTLFTSQRLVDFGGEGIRPMNLLYGTVVAMTPALFAMGSSAVQASTSIAALGSAGIGAALGLSAIGIAFKGIGDALTLRKTVLGQETTSAANSARDAVNAADDLAQSKRALANAQRDEARAGEKVHDARREAIRDLEDLRKAVRDLDNEYKSDTLSVAEAQQNLDATNANYFANALDRARAVQDLNDAKTRLADTALERKRKKEDLKISVSKGIEGSDKVRDAKERVRDARDQTLNAQAGLQKSTAGTIDKTTSAAAQLEQKLKDMSPAARDMYNWFVKNEDLFKRLQRQISQKTLPGFNTFLKAITAAPKGGKSTLQLAAEYAGQLGSIIGKYIGKLGEWTKSPLFRDSMARIQERNAAAFDKLGQALLILADPITRILDKASPGFESLSDTILKLSDSFAKWIKKLDENGGLAQWFEDSRVEAKKWYDIASNILTLLKNLFTAALPAGGSLVSSFRDFTKSLADWSSSPEGTKQISSFFDKIKNLPYADIIDFFKNAAVFFTVWRTVKFLKTLNPFFAALGAFASSNPAAAAAAMAGISDALVYVMKYAADNPKSITALLALVAGYKGLKAVGFSLKLPAVTALQTALTSKFKFLDKFIGGASTATMTVHAGVVNVYGKALGGTGVDLGGGKKPGKITKPGGLPGRAIPGALPMLGSAPSAIGTLAVGALTVAGGLIAASIIVDTVLGKPGTALEGFKALAMGPQAYSEWSKENAPGFKRFFSMTLPGWITAGGKQGWSSFNDAFKNDVGDIERFFSHTIPEFLTAGGKNGWSSFKDAFLNDIGLGGDAAGSKIPNFAAPALALEKNAYDRLSKDLFLTGGFNNAVAQDSLKVYIQRRKEAVSAYVRYIRSQEGPIAATKAEKDETEKSKTALKNLYLQYGETATNAKKYADEAYGVAAQTQTASDKTKNLNADLGTLSERLDAVTGVKKIILTISGEEKVFNNLETAVAYQQLIRTGQPATTANLNRYRLQFEKQTYAGGGRVTGYSPHDKADNIPAWLTANEYVQPVAAVKHYGTDFMEAVRTRRFPKYAEGGQVDSWPFKVLMPQDAADVVSPPAYGAPGGGKATGSIQVAEIAEATARSMGATQKQLIALIAAGLVESGMRNINYGDRDSVGFLQQRPSQGWGSVAQLLDPAYATRKFIQAARRMDSGKISAGELAARIQRPAKQFRGRYAQREDDAVAVLNRLAPYITVGTGGAGGTKAALIAFGRWLQVRGYDVSEHPAFGGVTKGGHVSNSQHYRASAIDVNHGAGTSTREQNYLRQIIPEGHRRGLRSIFMTAGHYDHAHFDLGAGHKDGGLVPRKYDSGGILPPGYSLAFNGTGKNETVRTNQQEQAITSPGITRLDRRDLALLAQYMAQVVGTPAITMDGRRVAETTNRYNYLPAGVQ